MTKPTPKLRRPLLVALVVALFAVPVIAQASPESDYALDQHGGPRDVDSDPVLNCGHTP